MYDIKELNEEQLIPATQSDGAFLVTAGAGSGKTRLLTHRICYLISECGVAPQNILAITFTNKATNEMKERIENMIPFAGQGVWISTFHSMCSRILRENIHHLEGYNRNFTIYDTSDKDKILKQILKDSQVEDNELKSKIASRIADIKNKGISAEEYVGGYMSDGDLTIEVYNKYQAYLKSNNGLDFDDLLVKTLELFDTCQEVLQRYQQRFKYIHVDEFQDTNLVQYKLMKKLAGFWKNVFVVGDEDQCIYGWRGANIENIYSFQKDFPNCRCYKLEQNYRSTKNILDSANKLIKHNTSRMDKTLWTNNVEGDVVHFVPCANESKEAEFVALKINQFIQAGVEPKQIGVLMRLSAMSRLIEEKLLNYNIPYVVSGIFKFFERLEIKNLVAYLRMLVNEKDNEAVLRVINFPKRGIGQTSIAKLVEIANDNGLSLQQVIENHESYGLPSTLTSKLQDFVSVIVRLKKSLEENSLGEFIHDAIKIIGIKDVYSSKSEEDMDRLLNIDQLEQSVIAFEKSNPACSLTDYLESITLASAVDEADDVKNAVNVSTVHASKGLEFDIVFIIGAEEGAFPISRAYDNTKDMEEERRLMYVAITRARKRLYITQAMSRFVYGERQQTSTTRFLKEMGIENEYEEFTTKRYDRNRDNYYSDNSDDYEGYSYNQNRDYSYNSFNKKDYSYSHEPAYASRKPSYKESPFVAQSAYKNSDYLNNYGKMNSVMDKKVQNQNSKDYEIGQQVLHPKFGIGEITNIAGQDVTIKFSGFGTKTLDISMAPLQIIKKKG